MTQRFPGGRGAWEGQAAGPAGLGDQPFVTHEPGGLLVKSLQTVAFDTFETVLSVLPDASIYSPSVSLNQTVKLDLGEYTVPKGRMFLLTNYKFGLVGLSGLEAGGGGELPTDQFQNSLGFDLTINRQRPATLNYQLVPVDPPTVLTVTAPDTLTVSTILVPSPRLAPASPAGLSLLPPRDTRQGDAQLPFTIFAQEAQAVAVSAVIFRRISTPITAIKASLQGYLISQQVGVSLLQRLRFR